MGILKNAGISFLRFISKSGCISGWILEFIGSICRQFPDGRWKEFIRSAIQQVKWKSIEFSQVHTKVGNITEVSLVPHLNQFDFDCMIWKQMPYEEEVFAVFDTMLGQYDVIFDIGSNVAYFHCMAKRNEKAKIYSFEPSGEAFARLTKNISNNRLQNIVAYNAAVSDQTGFVKFFEPEGHLTNGSLDPDFAKLLIIMLKKNICRCFR
ncbi:MAG: FkbM family methyltransferase [Saprospiraceae bacterium]|nr:FkbM family methyltransferase [Saprospiraceae bacterium]